MIAFIKGIVFAIGSNWVIIENNQIGYRIHYSRCENLKKGEEVTIYTYQYVREDELSLFGFASMEEYDLFIRLIQVKGIGPKTVMNILAKASVEQIITAIETEDVAFIKSLPGIGVKSASQVILDLKGKLINSQDTTNINTELLDAKAALKSLGYKNNEINTIIKELSKQKNLTTDEYLKAALLKLNQRKGV